MITKFLTEAPNQADILDRLAYDRVAFFKKSQCLSLLEYAEAEFELAKKPKIRTLQSDAAS